MSYVMDFLYGLMWNFLLGLCFTETVWRLLGRGAVRPTHEIVWPWIALAIMSLILGKP